MLLEDLFDTLATGELSQHSACMEGVLAPDKYATVINHLNKGLTSLHSHFPLAEKEVMVQQFDHITEYKLTHKYSLTAADPTVPYKWIIDSVDNPFLTDVIRIEKAFDELGFPLPINDEYAVDSLFTTAWDTLQIPFPNGESAVTLIYRAKHAKIAKDADPATTSVEIPPVLEEALQAYIAGRMYVAMGNAASASLSRYYTGRYEEQLQYVERNNLLNDAEGDSNIGLTQKGFI